MYDDCPVCGRYDHGFELSDTRTRLIISGCKCRDGCTCTLEDRGDDYAADECICHENGCECDDDSVVKIKVRRIYDRTCECGGMDYRCTFVVLLDELVIKTFDSETAAEHYVAKVFLTAKPPERDPAWESERFLRQAEGWG